MNQEARNDAALLRAAAADLSYNGSKEEAVRKHRLYEIAMRLETAGYGPRVRAANDAPEHQDVVGVPPAAFVHADCVSGCAQDSCPPGACALAVSERCHAARLRLAGRAIA